jgi:hypothetical protein
MIDNLRGADDYLAEIALAKRALHRHLAGEPSSLCGRRFTHTRRPMQFDALGYLVIDTCACLRPCGHDLGCLCEHDIDRLVYHVDGEGRDRYATRPLR